MTTQLENTLTKLIEIKREKLGGKRRVHFISKLKKKPNAVAFSQPSPRPVSSGKRLLMRRNVHTSKRVADRLKKWGKKPFFRKGVRKNAPLLKNKKKRIGGTIHIQSTQNNTIYTLTNSKGRVRNWISAGTCGFKNARQATSYASQAAAEKVAALAKYYKIAQINIKMSGLGPGKLSGVRALHQSGFRVSRIWECTTLPHNGCRPPKSRRI